MRLKTKTTGHNPLLERLILTVVVFAQLGCGPTVEDLVTDLGHPNTERRERALEFLRKTSVAGLSTYVEPLLADKEMSVRKQAARTLGRIGDANSIPQLAELLQDKALRKIVMKAMVRIGNRNAIFHLEGLLLHEDPNVRHRAKRYLERLRKHFADPHEIRSAAGMIYFARESIFPDFDDFFREYELSSTDNRER